jgi:imidazolonepropionase-like amidohydrolase
VVVAAHRRNKLVVAHALAILPFCMTLDAGADVLTHAPRDPRDEALDEGLVACMAAERRVAIPTLTIMEAVSRPLGLAALTKLLLRPMLLYKIVRATRNNPQAGAEQKYGNARDSVAAMYCAGVPILAGTDCHEEPTSPFLVKRSESLHRELELLVDASVSNLNAIRAATSLPAHHFGLDDRRVIEVGKRADLVLLSGNPLEDIRATHRIKQVWCAGIEYEFV